MRKEYNNVNEFLLDESVTEYQKRRWFIDEIGKINLHEKTRVYNLGLTHVLKAYNALVPESNRVDIYSYYLYKYTCARARAREKVFQNYKIAKGYDKKLQELENEFGRK